jgi:DNA-binding CsgD family transcriptional regulator
MASLFAFDLAGAAAQAAQAATAAEIIGHDLALCHALSVQAWVAARSGRPIEAVELSRRGIDVADRSVDSEPQFAHPRFFPGFPLCELDRLDEAEKVLQTGRRLAEDMGLVWSLPLYHSHIGVKRFLAGDWDGAVAEFEAGLAIADEVGLNVAVMTAASSWLAVIQLHRDDLAGAEQTLAGALRRLAEAGGIGVLLLDWAGALVQEARGDLDGALSLTWDVSMATGVITDAWSATALVRLCVMTGDHARAAALLPLLDQQALTGGTASMQGRALQCRGLVEGNVEILVRAVDAYRQSPRPPELAAACEDAGVHLAHADRLVEAIPFLVEANKLYDDIGALRDEARVRAELRKHGVTGGARGRQARASSGWESLTKTELKVLALVVQSLSNPEVAERMFVSRHTVESHLKHIYRKLGLASRVELAAEAARH